RRRFRGRMDRQVRRPGRSQYCLTMSLEALSALAAVATWLLLTWFTLVRPARRRGVATVPAGTAHDGARTAVVYASQTGTAVELAQRTVQALGRQAVLLPMDRVMPEQLAAYEQALFIVSTYGEGDAPDMAQAFHARMLASEPDGAGLGGLRAGILALGDSSYHHFCGFGMALDEWLQRRDATLLFDTIRVDRGDPRALD